MTARKPRVLRREAEARRLAKRFGHDKRAGGAGARLRLSSKVFQKSQFLPRIRRAAGAATQTAVAIPGAESTFSRTSARFSGRSSPAEAADRTSPPSPPSCRGATQRVASRSGLGQAAASTSVAIPGADSTFSRTSARFSGRSSPAEAADRTTPPSCRGATQRVASRSGLGQAATQTAAAIPGAESTFSRASARFSGRSSPAEAADRTSPPSCRGATQRVASRSGLGQAAASTAVAIPGAESTFSRTSARFSGRSSPAEAADRTSPPSCRGATQRVASRSGLGQAAASTSVAIPGAEFNLFKDFRPIFQALVACRSGGPNLSRPHAEERRSASRPEAGSIRRRRSNLRKPPSTGSGRGRERAGPTRMSRIWRRAAPLAEARRGGAASRQADTGGVLVLPGLREQKQNTLSPTWQDIVGFFRRPLGEAPAIRARGRARAARVGAPWGPDQHCKTRKGPSTAFRPRARSQRAAVRGRRRRLRRCECAWRARSTSRRSYRRRSRRCGRFAR